MKSFDNVVDLIPDGCVFYENKFRPINGVIFTSILVNTYLE